MEVNAVIVQSGGPTAVINNSVIGLLEKMIESEFNGNIYGAIGGIQGLLNKEFKALQNLSFDDRNKLRWTPGAALGTCRHKLLECEVEIIIKNLKEYNIKYFFYIGGNGSMQVSKMIDEKSKQMNYTLHVIGIPKSIDNDLLYTDHSPGYGSAAKFLATSILEMKRDVASFPNSNRVMIVETMGRHTGWLAAACSLVTKIDKVCQTLIYIPEVSFDLEQCLTRIESAYKEGKSTFIIIAEGIKDKEGKYINEEQLSFDQLNRAKLGGVANYLKNIIEERTSIPTRSIAPSIWQRSSVYLASKTDAEEAFQVGREAWKLAEQGYSGKMVVMKRIGKNNPYKVKYDSVPLDQVAGKEKFVPSSWYDKDTCQMKDYFIEYITPLIYGEVEIPTENGLPIYKSII